MEIIFNKNQIKDAVNFVLKNKKFLIIRIDGEIGSGKTTLIKSLCESLGVLQNVSSPTFSIVNEYLINEKSKIFHFDFFRIKNPIEALDIGLEDYLESNPDAKTMDNTTLKMPPKDYILPLPKPKDD